MKEALVGFIIFVFIIILMSWLGHAVRQSIDQAGGTRQIVVDTGKGIVSIIDDIIAEEKK